MFNKPFHKHHKKLKKYNDESGVLETALERADPESKRFQKLSQELSDLKRTIDEYIETSYALAVFEFYQNTQPALVADASGKEVAWADAFGCNFDRLTKNQRHALVGIAEGYGQYRLK